MCAKLDLARGFLSVKNKYLNKPAFTTRDVPKDFFGETTE